MRQVPVGQRSAVTIGQLAGFNIEADIVHDSTGTFARLGLAGIPRQLGALDRHELRHLNPLGLLTRIENLTGDLEGRAGAADRHRSGRSPPRSSQSRRADRPAV